jgi:flagellar basal-body rod protein FlgC
MSFFDVLGISGSAMNAQMIRMNTISSNLANVGVAASSAEEAYKAKRPVFRTIYDNFSEQYKATVQVDGIANSDKPNDRRFEPDNPLADENGYIYISNVNSIEEMVDMTIASRSYQSNVEAINTAKKLVLNTLRLGQ